mgnify:CR=1 FL=1
MTDLAIGKPVLRKEDARFLTGAGQYTDDIVLPRQAHASFLRSPYAHATIKGIDLAAARAMPGVIAIYTGKDLPDSVGGLPCGWLITGTDGKPMKEPKHPLLAQGKVRHVGDPVAIVIRYTYVDEHGEPHEGYATNEQTFANLPEQVIGRLAAWLAIREAYDAL